MENILYILQNIYLEADQPDKSGESPDDKNPLEDEEDEKDADGAGSEDNPLQDPGNDQPSPAESAPPLAPPKQLASHAECLYVDTILRALTFAPKQIPPKALVLFDFTEPEKIIQFVTNPDILGKSKLTNKDNDRVNPLEDSSIQPTELPFPDRHKHHLAQLILKALKYDSKDMSVDSSMLADEVTPENARSLQKELSTLLAI